MSQFKKKCLIVDDDPIVLEFFKFALGERAELIYLDSGRDVLRAVQGHAFDAAFIDLCLPDGNGHQLVREIKAYLPGLPVVVISSSEEIQDAIAAFRLGAIDFLTKPLDPNLLQQVFRKCVGQQDLEKAHQILIEKNHQQAQLIVGEAKIIKTLREDIAQLKGSEIDTLILAESGCGKELVARSLHQQERDSSRPYITLNCSAIPKELMESILFGHEKGSFTGADKKQIGKFELAHNGDIFLDEVGTLSLDLQAKLLRVLQEREIEPIGSGVTKKLNFRVIAATNEDLAGLVRAGTFRKDLYYRLNKVTLKVPALRERRDDIPMLVTHFLKKCSRNGIIKEITEGGLDLLMQHNWPGNVRELENTIENLNFTTRGQTIQVSDIEKLNLETNLLPTADSQASKPVIESNQVVASENSSGSLEEKLMKYERSLLESALKKFKKKQDVAEHLQMDRKTLFRKVKQYGLE